MCQVLGSFSVINMEGIMLKTNGLLNKGLSPKRWLNNSYWTGLGKNFRVMIEQASTIISEIGELEESANTTLDEGCNLDTKYQFSLAYTRKLSLSPKRFSSNKFLKGIRILKMKPSAREIAQNPYGKDSDCSLIRRQLSDKR